MRNARRTATVAALALVALVALVSVLRPSNDAEAKADANPGARDVIVHLFEWPWASIAVMPGATSWPHSYLLTLPAWSARIFRTFWK